MFNRSLALPAAGTETFFLWGPRQTGKTTLLRRAYPDAFWVDLLRSEDYRDYLARPELLRERLRAARNVSQVVIDEVQKVPALLDEVHLLHERDAIRFALCGSSARKVRRGAANLLGGRAIRYELHGLTAAELGREFDLDRALNQGWFPRIYEAERPRRLLRAYVGDYLKEEVAAEGLVRKLPVFSEFLNAAALSDGNLVNFSNIARDCRVSSPTVKGYFEILVDTLLGRWLPGYTKRPKRRVIAVPKFYFSDIGIVNELGRRGRLERGSELYGKALESWVFHELCAYDAYSEAFEPMAYWRLAGGTEVDFIVGNMKLAIEVKATTRATSDHLKGLRALVQDQPRVQSRILVCLESKRRRTEDDILIMPAKAFAADLAAGRLF